MTVNSDNKEQIVRVVLQQPSLPKYRVPAFASLAKREGIHLRVVYDNGDHIPNVEAEGFEAQPMAMWRGQLGRHPVMWHTAQWRFATRLRCDVLILSWDMHYLSLLPALLRAKWNGVHTVLWGHGYSKQEAGWRSWLRSRLARLGTALLMYNRTTAQAYVQAGWDPRRVFVALNCLDQTPIQKARHRWLSEPHRLEEFRREHGLTDTPTILFVSRLDRANRADLLLSSAAELSKSIPTLNVVIIGKGIEQQRLQALASDLGIANRVRFLGAIYNEMDLAPWFLSANLFCYPSNIGLSLLHAFGYGLPVVTGDKIQAQNPEIEALRDGENGLLYRDGDAASLTTTLRRILNDTQLATRLSRNALSTATEQFTIENMVNGMADAIRYCVQRQSRADR